MNLTLRELDALRRVIDLGSITAAAAVLHVSQPALTRTLQHIELRLGFPLFHREKKRLRPTSEALALFPQILRAVASVEVVERLVADLRIGRSGVLTVAAVPVFAAAVMPKVIARFRAERPDVSIVLQPESAVVVGNLVATGRADLGVTFGPAVDPEVVGRKLCATEIGCVLPTDHPAAAASELHPADVAGLPLVCPGRHLPTGELIARAFREAGVPLSIAVEVPHATIACSMVRAGVGVAILDGFALLAAAHDPALAVRPFRPKMPIEAWLLRPRQRHGVRMVADFVETLERTSVEFVPSPRAR